MEVNQGQNQADDVSQLALENLSVLPEEPEEAAGKARAGHFLQTAAPLDKQQKMDAWIDV